MVSTPAKIAFRRRFGDAGSGAAGSELILPCLAPEVMRFVISAGVACGVLVSTRATTPATCGQAMEVPLMVAEAVSLALPADLMLEPGAKMSTQVP